MKALFIDPPGWQKESVNLGVALLAGSLKKHGHSCAIIDANSSSVSDDDLILRIASFSPDVVGISIKTATAREGARLGTVVRKAFPGVTLIVGGPHITLCADEFMNNNPQFDYAIMSEAEEAIVVFANAVDAGKGLGAAIPNLVWRENGKVVTNKWSPPADLDTLPLPSFESIQGFSHEGFRYPIVTSRGCPFKCTYCCVNKLTGSFKWRRATPERVVNELEFVAKEYGIRQFEIWDDNFTLDVKRAKEICRLLIKRRLGLPWYCHNGIRADKIDEELAHLMKSAGCTSIAFGVESGNEEVFDSINKGENLSDIVDAVKTIKKAGINAVGYYLIGIPGDTLEKFIVTVEFQRALPFDHFVYGMLVPYPKTEVWDVVSQRGRFLERITDTQHFSEDLAPVSFEMPEFPKEDMIRAYYISKYYDLFKLIKADDPKERLIAYFHAPGMETGIAGMSIAAGAGARHLIVTCDPASVDLSRPAFKQVPETVRIEVVSPTQLASLISKSVAKLIVVAQKVSMKEAKDTLGKDGLLFEFRPKDPLFPIVRVGNNPLSSPQGIN